MKRGLVFAAIGLARLLATSPSAAQGSAPVQLTWQAPANCPQATQVREKLRDLLGGNAADATPSRLRAEGLIEAIGERYRLTLNIHYDLVNGRRVVQANSCDDLGGVAAVTLALLFRTEHSSSAPLTARDLGGAAMAAGTDNRALDSDTRKAEPAPPTAALGNSPSVNSSASNERAHDDPSHDAAAHAAASSRWRFVFRVPELRVDVGVLPEANVGAGLAVGLSQGAWRILASGSLWLAQDYDPGPFSGYGAHFGRVSGELSGCRGFPLTGFELAPCLVLTLDDVSARGTGVGISSTSPRTAWVSIGAGLEGRWWLNRNAALVFGLNGRLATSKPRFISESIGDIWQVPAGALGAVLGCEWVL